jgi:putative phosphoesterase
VRIGIVSDVHGNARGLALALERMGEVDELLCAGDMVEEFRFCNDTIEILRDRDATCVLGNHDLGMLAPHGERARTAAHVRPDLVEWLASHPLRHDLKVDGKQLLMTHASPIAPHNQYVVPNSPELKRMAEIEADYIVIGHSHTQIVQRVGRALVINPGSVGQARDHSNGRRLSYAVLDTETDHVEIDNYELHPIVASGGTGGSTER